MFELTLVSGSRLILLCEIYFSVGASFERVLVALGIRICHNLADIDVLLVWK
jgi:hypothetical protein